MSRFDAPSVRRGLPTKTTAAAHPGALNRTAAKELAVAAIARTEAVVREETLALKTTCLFDLRDSTNRKSQLIVDLNASLNLLGASELGGDLRKKLEILRGVLVDNMSAIKVHLEAVREIAGLLSDAAHDAESDGTYSKVTLGGRRL